jgi:hypothetical protein
MKMFQTKIVQQYCFSPFSWGQLWIVVARSSCLYSTVRHQHLASSGKNWFAEEGVKAGVRAVLADRCAVLHPMIRMGIWGTWLTMAVMSLNDTTRTR